MFLTFFNIFQNSVYMYTYSVYKRAHTHKHTHSLPVIQACSCSSLIFILVTWWTLHITPCDWFYDNNPDCFRRAWLMETWESIIQWYVTTTASLFTHILLDKYTHQRSEMLQMHSSNHTHTQPVWLVHVLLHSCVLICSPWGAAGCGNYRSSARRQITREKYI